MVLAFDLARKYSGSSVSAMRFERSTHRDSAGRASAGQKAVCGQGQGRTADLPLFRELRLPRSGYQCGTARAIRVRHQCLTTIDLGSLAASP